MDVIDRQRQTFSQVAELYERARPSYPDPLIDDVLEISRIAPGARILEIGAGTGKATRLFARRGHPLTCIEPGAELLAVARRVLAEHREVELVETTFEDWEARVGGYALVVSAQAFHWVDPEVGYEKAARALTPGGWLALFWNRPWLRVETVPLENEIAAIYARHADAFDPLARSSPSPDAGGRREGTPARARLDASLRFERAEERAYTWQQTYTTSEYLDLQRTQSNHRLLPEAARESLLGAVGAAIDAAGGRYEMTYTSELLIARRRD